MESLKEGIKNGKKKVKTDGRMDGGTGWADDGRMHASMYGLSYEIIERRKDV